MQEEEQGKMDQLMHSKRTVQPSVMLFFCILGILSNNYFTCTAFSARLHQNQKQDYLVKRLFSSVPGKYDDELKNNDQIIANRRSFVIGSLFNAGLVSAMTIPKAWGQAVEGVTQPTITFVGDTPSLSANTIENLSVNSIEMKTFVDPYGMFDIDVPQGFYTLRRTAKGDLPDAKGKGRRGSSIFTAGNMAKAEVVAVERYPTRLLLEENGIEATGKLTTFPEIGEPAVVAGLIYQRREKDKPTNGNTILDNSSVAVSDDGKELQFRLKTEIDVQRPELLMEQYGVDRLIRITLAKASLNSNDGNLLAVFASALETDFNGPDGDALQKTVKSFRAMDREFGF